MPARTQFYLFGAAAVTHLIAATWLPCFVRAEDSTVHDQQPQDIRSEQTEQLKELAGKHTKQIADHPDDPAAHFSRGCIRFLLKDFEKAVADFSVAIKLRPKHANALFNRAICHFMLDQYDAAQADFSKVVDMCPEQAFGYRGLGHVQMKQGRLAEAKASFDRAIEIRYGDPLAFFGRALAFQALGEAEHAIADYSRVLEFAPNHHRARLYRSLLYRKRGNLDEAISDLGELIRTHPQDATLLQLRAAVFHEAKRYREELSDLTAAMEFAQASPILHFRLAVVYRHLGQEADAQAEIEAIKRLYATDPHAFRGSVQNGDVLDLVDLAKRFARQYGDSLSEPQLRRLFREEDDDGSTNCGLDPHMPAPSSRGSRRE
jgi:tetratricopeptide (TPR) repeat protein